MEFGFLDFIQKNDFLLIFLNHSGKGERTEAMQADPLSGGSPLTQLTLSPGGAFYPLFYVLDRTLLPADVSNEVLTHLQNSSPPIPLATNSKTPVVIDTGEFVNDLVVISREQIDDSLLKDKKSRGAARGAVASAAPKVASPIKADVKKVYFFLLSCFSGEIDL